MFRMNEFWYEKLENMYKEIAEDSISESQIDSVIEVYDRLMNFSNRARNEGLLAIEEAGESLNYNDDLQSFFGLLIMLVVDGTDPQDVFGIGMNKILAMNMQGLNGLMAMMYLHGALIIQAGYNNYIADKYLKSYMPPAIMKEYVRRECENALPKALAEVEQDQELIQSLCKNGGEIEKTDHSIVGETAKSLLLLTDKDMQRLLRDISNSDLSVAMKGLPGRARAQIFDNMSHRLAVMLAKAIEYMGPVRMRDVEDCCVHIMKTLLKLSDCGEIQDYDLSILKVVIDMYEAAESENLKLKDKYKELRTIIDKIYKD